jgi:urea transporter
VHLALQAALRDLDLPVLTLPFVLVVWMVLLARGHLVDRPAR